MAIYVELRVQLQELMNLVKQDEQYAAAVAHGAVQADRGTAEAHRQHATCIVELKRHSA